MSAVSRGRERWAPQHVPPASPPPPPPRSPRVPQTEHGSLPQGPRPVPDPMHIPKPFLGSCFAFRVAPTGHNSGPGQRPVSVWRSRGAVRELGRGSRRPVGGLPGGGESARCFVAFSGKEGTETASTVQRGVTGALHGPGLTRGAKAAATSGAALVRLRPGRKRSAGAHQRWGGGGGLHGGRGVAV